MTTIDANGAKHDNLGRYADQGKPDAGFDLAPTPDHDTFSPAHLLCDLIQPGRSQVFSAKEHGFQDDGDVTVERGTFGELWATTTVTMDAESIAPEDTPRPRKGGLLANPKSEWVYDRRDTVRDYFAEQYGATYVEFVMDRGSRVHVEVGFTADLDDEATPTDAMTAIRNDTKASFLRYELRTQADGNLDTPTNRAVADYARDTERLNDILRKTDTLKRGWKVGNLGRSDSRLKITPAADKHSGVITVRVARRDQEGFDNDGSADLEVRVVDEGHSPQGYHGNDLHPGWSLAHPNGDPLTPEENTEFLRAMGEKITNRPDDPGTYQGPDTAVSTISDVMKAWRR